MKKGLIATVIAIIIVAGAAYGHHELKVKNEKATTNNELALMNQEIKDGNVKGATTELTKVMEGADPLTKTQEQEYSKEIDSISGDNQISQNTVMTVGEIIKTYLNVNGINSMNGIEEASVNGVEFYEADEAAAPNGKLINTNQKIKPIEIFNGVYGYEFEMQKLNSKVENYFYMSQSGNIYTWNDVLNAFKNGTLKVKIANSSNANKLASEYGPNGSDEVYNIWKTA
ncbi:MAG: hypothetical protein ACRC57_04135 [Sarcina sp.]